MKTLLGSVAIGLGALLCQSVYAQDSAAHTALCKDGTYYDGTTHKGACKGHQGVKEWLDKTAAKTDTKSDAKAATTSSTAATTDDTTTKKHHRKKDDSATTTAPATTAPAAKTATTATTAAPTSTATTAQTKEETQPKHTAPTPAKDITAKPGGGPGLVWVNAESKVYHCPGDEWYGKTKQGSYMSAADAEKAGAHPAHGKACQ